MLPRSYFSLTFGVLRCDGCCFYGSISHVKACVRGVVSLCEFIFFFESFRRYDVSSQCPEKNMWMLEMKATHTEIIETEKRKQTPPLSRPPHLITEIDWRFFFFIGAAPSVCFRGPPLDSLSCEKNLQLFFCAMVVSSCTCQSAVPWSVDLFYFRPNVPSVEEFISERWYQSQKRKIAADSQNVHLS